MLAPFICLPGPITQPTKLFTLSLIQKISYRTQDEKNQQEIFQTANILFIPSDHKLLLATLDLKHHKPHTLMVIKHELLPLFLVVYVLYEK